MLYYEFLRWAPFITWLYLLGWFSCHILSISNLAGHLPIMSKLVIVIVRLEAILSSIALSLSVHTLNIHSCPICWAYFLIVSLLGYFLKLIALPAWSVDSWKFLSFDRHGGSLCSAQLIHQSVCCCLRSLWDLLNALRALELMKQLDDFRHHFDGLFLWRIVVVHN
jgi:hypothetical protein